MKLQPGTYYIGDPCYILPNRDWSKILNQTNYFDGEIYQLYGKNVWGHGTAYGDGSYPDQFGNSYPVDAGLIAVIPIEICDFEGNGYKLEGDKILDTRSLNFQFEPGYIFTFNQEFEVVYSNGIFEIGHIRIDTEGDSYDDEI